MSNNKIKYFFNKFRRENQGIQLMYNAEKHKSVYNVRFTVENDIPKPIVMYIGIGNIIDEPDNNLLPQY